MIDGIPNRPFYFYQKDIIDWDTPILGQAHICQLG